MFGYVSLYGPHRLCSRRPDSGEGGEHPAVVYLQFVDVNGRRGNEVLGPEQNEHDCEEGDHCSVTHHPTSKPPSPSFHRPLPCGSAAPAAKRSCVRGYTHL